MQKDDHQAGGKSLSNNIAIGVTPLFVQGDMVVCDIDPPSNYHKGGHMKLPKGRAKLAFSLQAGTPANLKFRTKPNGDSDAFWCDAIACPAHEMTDPQYSNAQVSNNGTTVTVDVVPNGQTNAVFYRLNFDNGCSFDPIIIHQ